MIFLASKSSLTVSAYQLTLPSNLPRSFSLSLLSSSVWVSSLFRRAEKKAFFNVSYFRLLMFLPVLPNGCLVSIFGSTIFVSLVLTCASADEYSGDQEYFHENGCECRGSRSRSFGTGQVPPRPPGKTGKDAGRMPALQHPHPLKSERDAAPARNGMRRGRR